MNIPTLSIPKYTTKLINGDTVQFRSFLVKEEKILLLAQQTGDITSIIAAIKEIVDLCTFNKLNMDKLPIIDLIWLIIKIRMKSVGENAKFRIQCSDKTCETDIECVYDLETVTQPDVSKVNFTVPITPEVGVIMRFPTTKSLDLLTSGDTTDRVDQYFNVITNCIESIYDAKEVMSVDDIKAEDLTKFVENLTPEQFKKLVDTHKSFPVIVKNIAVSCPKCKKPHDIPLKGILDFFG